MAAKSERLYGDRFLAGLARAELGPVYLLAGEETVGKQRAVELFEARLVEPATRAFNFIRLHGEDTSVVELVDLARTLPMMGGRRLLVVVDVERCRGEVAELARYLDDPNPATCLVACTEQRVRPPKSAAPTPRDGIPTALARRGVLVEFYPPFQNRRAAWLDGYARSLGLRLERAASELLLARGGDDLARVAAELPKLALHADGGTIRRGDVEELMGRGAQGVWDLARAVCRRDPGAALSVWRRLVAQGGNALDVVPALAFSLRRLLRAQGGRSEGRPVEAIARELRVFGADRVRELGEQVDRYAESELATVLVELQRLELDIKSGRAQPVAAMEAFLLRNLAPSGRATNPGGGRGRRDLPWRSRPDARSSRSRR